MGGEACQVEPASWIRPGHIWLPSSLTELENVMKRRKQNTKKKNVLFAMPSTVLFLLGLSELLANVCSIQFLGFWTFFVTEKGSCALIQFSTLSTELTAAVPRSIPL